MVAILPLSGCSRERAAKVEEVNWLAKCIASTPDQGQSLRLPVKSPPTPVLPRNRYQVYVDVSASMRPYLVETSEARSRYRLLLKELGQIAPERLDCFAFGVPGEATRLFAAPTPSQPGPVVAPSIQPPPSSISLASLGNEGTYVRRSNEFVPLLRPFHPTPGLTGTAVQRLVVSDWVESPTNAAQGSAMGGTAGEINRWISEGGTFAVFLFRTPYRCDAKRGLFYFSELRRESGMRGEGVRVPYQTEQRPFALFAFLSSPAALTQLKSDLKNVLRESERWTLEICPPMTLQPWQVLADEALPVSGSPRTGFVDTHYELPEFPPVPGYVLLPAPGSNGRIPLRFQIRARSDSTAGLTSLASAATEAMEVTCHRLESAPGQNPVPRWEPWAITAGRDYTVTPPTVAGGPGLLTLLVPERPKGLGKRLWYVGVAPPSGGTATGYDTEVSAYSTRDDSDPKAQDRILNFQSLIDEVCRNRTPVGFTPASGLVVTD